MPQDNQTQIENQVRLKVQGETDERVARFQEMRRSEQNKQARSVKSQIDSDKKEKNREMHPGEAQNTSLAVFQSEASLGIVFALGITLSLINDFSDLVTWQKISLISQTLDITTLILFVGMMMFASRAYFLSIFIILFAFLLEILPVIGVLPWWTIGIAIWYMANRKS